MVLLRFEIIIYFQNSKKNYSQISQYILILAFHYMVIEPLWQPRLMTRCPRFYRLVLRIDRWMIVFIIREVNVWHSQIRLHGRYHTTFITNLTHISCIKLIVTIVIIVSCNKRRVCSIPIILITNIKLSNVILTNVTISIIYSS